MFHKAGDDFNLGADRYRVPRHSRWKWGERGAKAAFGRKNRRVKCDLLSISQRVYTSK